MRSLLLLLLFPLALLAADIPTFSGAVLAPGTFAATAGEHLAQVAGRAIAKPNLSAASFAVINRAALVDVTATVRRTLSRTYGIGISPVASGWDNRFDCEAFAIAYTLELRARLMRDLWSTRSPADRPACFIFCYHKDQPGRPAHALLYLQTTEGPVFLDPLVGPVNLNATEVASIYYVNL